MLIEYKKCAKARYCIRQHEQSYRRQFIQSISYTTSISSAWKKICMMRAQPTNTFFQQMHNEILLVTAEERANLICHNLQETAQPNLAYPPENLWE
jgi:hypothetical protein